MPPVRTEPYSKNPVPSEVERIPAYLRSELAGIQRAIPILTRALTFGASVPTTGTWLRGDIVFDLTPTAGSFIGWVCTASGTPGTWKTWGAISP